MNDTIKYLHAPMARMAGGGPPVPGAEGDGSAGCCALIIFLAVLLFAILFPRQLLPLAAVGIIEYFVLSALIRNASNHLPEDYEDQSAVSFFDKDTAAAEEVRILSRYVSDTNRLLSLEALLSAVISKDNPCRASIVESLEYHRREMSCAEPGLRQLTAVPSEASYRDALKNIRNIKGINTEKIIRLINGRLLEYGRKNDVYTKGVEYLLQGNPRLAAENFRVLGDFKNSGEMLAAARNIVRNADNRRNIDWQIALTVILGFIVLIAVYYICAVCLT